MTRVKIGYNVGAMRCLGYWND